MIKSLRSTILFLFALAFSGQTLAAGAFGTPEEAMEMVKKAVAFAKANSKDAFFKEVGNPKGKFIDRDLYVAVFDGNGVVMAHGANAKLVGKDVSTLNDTDGKFFIKEMLMQAKANGKGTTDYKWPHPETKEYQAKSTYYEMHDGMVIMCGYYKR